MSKTIILIDGENLVFRYQALLKEGRTPRAENIHEPDVFVWQRDRYMTRTLPDVVRVTYYTSVVGDESTILAVKSRIQEIDFLYRGNSCRLNGAVFKKGRQNQKAKSVDINIAIDALTQPADRVCLVTGDADFIPLVDALMRSGKQVYIWAFSSGLSAPLRASGDRFKLLDNVFFVEPGAEI